MTIKKILSASALIAFGMVAGRVLGFFREMLLAANFGSGDDANIAISLLLIPDFVTALLIGSAISGVLIPAFAERDFARSFALFWQSLWLFVAVFMGLAVLLSLFFNSKFITIALCSLPLTAATGVFTAYLQHQRKFIVPAFATVIFNSVILFSLWALPSDLLMLAAAVIFASFARFIAGFAEFFRAGGKYINIFSVKSEINRSLLNAYIQTTASNMLGILVLYTPFALAAVFSLNDFSLFNYAFKLIIFPASLIQTIIQTVLLPWFVSNTYSRSSTDKTYSYSIISGFAISIFVAVIVTVISGFIAEICFGHGKMTLQDTAVIGRLLSIGIWATPFIVLSSLYQQIFYAHKNTKIVLTANIILVLAVAPLCFVGHIMLGNEGMLIGFVVAQAIAVIMLMMHRRKVIEDGV